MPTTNLGLTYPTEGGDEDTWGAILNDLFDDLDAFFAADGTGGAVGVHVGSGKVLAFTGGGKVAGAVDMTGTGGGQIVFPATQNPSANANTLDDYEEGTFTPQINFGGSHGSPTYVTQLGRYTKIGNSVRFRVTILMSNKGAATGDLTIELMPFTSANISGAFSGGGLHIEGVTSGVVSPSWFIAPNSTALSIRNLSGGSSGAITNSQCNNNLNIIVNGEYETA